MKCKRKNELETNVARDIVYRRPCDLKPWPRNPRTHNDKQLANLKTSIKGRRVLVSVEMDYLFNSQVVVNTLGSAHILF